MDTPDSRLAEFERQEQERLRRQAEHTPEQIEAFRRMTPAERFAQTVRLSQEHRDRWREAVRAAYPDADEQEIGLLVMERVYGEDVDAGAVRARLGRERTRD